MPTVSGNVGAVFSGGAVTTPLTNGHTSLGINTTGTATLQTSALGESAHLVLSSPDGGAASLDTDAGLIVGPSGSPGTNVVVLKDRNGATMMDVQDQNGFNEVDVLGALYVTPEHTGEGFHAQTSGGGDIIATTDTGHLGFFAASPTAKPTVTGSKGANAALTSLMTALVALGLVTDSTT